MAIPAPLFVNTLYSPITVPSASDTARAEPELHIIYGTVAEAAPATVISDSFNAVLSNNTAPVPLSVRSIPVLDLKSA